MTLGITTVVIQLGHVTLIYGLDCYYSKSKDGAVYYLLKKHMINVMSISLIPTSQKNFEIIEANWFILFFLT